MIAERRDLSALAFGKIGGVIPYSESEKMRIRRRLASLFEGRDATPSRPVRVMVPFPPGSTSDTLARLLGQSLTERLGQPIVIENRPGAAGNFATEAVVRVRLDRKATSISLLVVIGVRTDGQKVLLAIKQMGGESTEAWRTVLDDIIKRGLRRPRRGGRGADPDREPV